MDNVNNDMLKEGIKLDQANIDKLIKTQDMINKINGVLSTLKEIGVDVSGVQKQIESSNQISAQILKTFGQGNG